MRLLTDVATLVSDDTRVQFSVGMPFDPLTNSSNTVNLVSARLVGVCFIQNPTFVIIMCFLLKQGQLLI